MPLEIDTGTKEQTAWQPDKVQLLLDSVRDELPETATQTQIDGKVVEYIVGDLRAPKRLETKRRHLVQYWPLIAPLAVREPEQFDSLILEFAELVS